MTNMEANKQTIKQNTQSQDEAMKKVERSYLRRLQNP